MSDAFQWLINLVADQVAVALGGLTVLLLLIEFLIHFRDWTTWKP